MNPHANRQNTLARRVASRPLAILACLLPALCGACSWVQALQDNFKFSFADTRDPATAVPVTEVPVRMVYPDGTNTVDEAVSYMLEPHAYRPAYRDAPGETVAQRIFINNFDHDPVPLSVAMQRLMGRGEQVVLDRDRKLYAFRPRHAGEPGIAFADLGIETPASAARPSFRERLAQPVPAADGNDAPGAGTTLPDTGLPHTQAEHKTRPDEDRNSCRSIQFRNRAMLSATVREYFLGCGFDEVLWKLGEPGRYADYRLLQDIDVPLPERHLDLIDLLQTSFGISTLINEDNRVEFHDENSTL